MSNENEVTKATEIIIRYKADKLKNRNKYPKYVLERHKLEVNEEAINVFNMGAVDAMIYDMGAGLDLAEFKKPNTRIRLLREIFPPKK